jgi:microcystin-dependent protein
MSVVFPISIDARFRKSTAVGGETTFTVPFPFQDNGDITLIKTSVSGVITTLNNPTDYTLTGAGNAAGGTATLVVAAVAGEIYTRVSTALLQRLTDMAQAGRFRSAAFDDDFDRLTIIAQEQARDLGRALMVDYGASQPSLTVGAADTLLKVDASGNIVAGPTAAAVDALGAALGISAGRALIYPITGPEIYDAGNRQIANVADGTLTGDAANKGQLDTAVAAVAANVVPVGASILWNGTSAPAGYLKENGAAISRTTYAALFAVIGTTYGAGDGSTTFNVPESRGEFIRGLDDGRGVDSGRGIATAQAELIGPHTHPGSTATGGAHTHTLLPDGMAHGLNGASTSLFQSSDGDQTTSSKPTAQATSSDGDHTHTITVSANSGAENRPRNVAKLICIKY